MIKGIGMDIVEIDRVAEAIQRQRFIDRVFTFEEQEYCDRRGTGRAASYAARFAAKEAVLKALGTGLSGEGTWLEVEVVKEKSGKPGIQLHGYFARLAMEAGVTGIYISLTHAKQYAAAQAILWGGTDGEGSNS